MIKIILKWQAFTFARSRTSKLKEIMKDPTMQQAMKPIMDNVKAQIKNLQQQYKDKKIEKEKFVSEEAVPLNREKMIEDQKLKLNVKKMVATGLKKQEILKSFVPANQEQQLKQQKPKKKQKGISISEITKSDQNQQQISLPFPIPQHNQLQVQMAKQQMLINQIMQKHKPKKKQQKQSSLKDVHPNQLPISSRHNSKPLSPQQQQLASQQILQKLKQSNSVKQLPFQSQLNTKYSSSLLQEARKKKDQELKYYKELVQEPFIKQFDQKFVDPTKVKIQFRRLKKGDTYAQLRNQDKQLILTRKQDKLQKKYEQDMYRQLAFKQKYFGQDRHQSTQIVQYEDEQYYKQKSLKQFQKSQQVALLTKSYSLSSAKNEYRNMGNEPSQALVANQDEQILKAGQADSEAAVSLNSILIQQLEEKQGEVDEYKQELYEKSSFGMIDKKMHDIQEKLKKHGIDVDVQELRHMKKELLFDEKKFRQEQLEYQKYLMRKQKKDKMKEYFKKIHKQKLRQDLDFEIQIRDRYKDYKYDPLDVQANMKKLNQLNLQRKSLLVGEDVRTKNHFKKTEKNMQRFIMSYIYQGFQNPNQRLYQKIQITGIKYNEKKTVVHVFWKLEQQQPKKNQQKIKDTQKMLQSKSLYISGKMTQVLGLRYGPDIRFHYDKLLPRSQQIKKQLVKNKEEVINFQLQNLMKKGYIKTQQQLEDKKSKLQTIASENIKNYHNRDRLLSKKYRKNQKANSSSSGNSNNNNNNKNSQISNIDQHKKKTAQQWDQVDIRGRPKRTRRKNSEEKFWEHVDKL